MCDLYVAKRHAFCWGALLLYETCIYSFWEKGHASWHYVIVLHVPNVYLLNDCEKRSLSAQSDL